MTSGKVCDSLERRVPGYAPRIKVNREISFKFIYQDYILNFFIGYEPEIAAKLSNIAPCAQRVLAAKEGQISETISCFL
jgi:hypothetical protein